MSSGPNIDGNPQLASTSRQQRADADDKEGCRRLPILILAITLVVLCSTAAFFVIPPTVKELPSVEKQLKKEALDLGDKLTNALAHLSMIQKEEEDLEKKIVALKKENKELKAGGNGSGNNNNNNKEQVEDLKNSHMLLTEANHRLVTELQRLAKDSVLAKFGPGPHRVEIILDFPPNTSPPGTASKFTIELAPLDYMPHSVSLFLSQVSLGLWDGCSFHRNAGHVVQGGPTPYFRTNHENVRKPFKDAGLMSVAFQEYHPNYPHIKYTVGYAGRPGGPDWYVSTVDNTKNHGPGGQSSYAIPSEADPCFGKVIEGFDAVDRMAQMSVQEGGYRAMKENVGIASARLLSKEVE